MDSGTSDSEEGIAAAWARGDHAAAATLTFELYSAEILAFLGTRMNPSDADEVFGAFAEKLWAGLPGFQWRSSMRSWAYRLARNAAIDHARGAHNRGGRFVGLSGHDGVLDALDRARTATAAYRRTEVKTKMQQLRAALPPDDQMLLVLRVDRGMGFRELAEAMADGERALDPADITRDAARLRKRFERVKARLREMAEAEGLL